MYQQAEPVRFSGPGSGQTGRPAPQPPPAHPTGPPGPVRHGKLREDDETSSHTYENAETVKRSAAYTPADRTYPGVPVGRRGLRSFIRSHRSCLATGIAVLLSLAAVGLVPLTFINKQEISQLATTVGALKHNQDNMSATVDVLKHGQGNMCTNANALKRHQDDVGQLSTAVDALQRDQDDKGQLSTTVDALKSDLDIEQRRTTALEQRLQEMKKTLLSCPGGYKTFRGTCYKVFDIRKSFDEAAATCGADGGTLAMPRDTETNEFLISLYRSVSGRLFWFGLHDRRKEGRFEWVDGSPLGEYTSWAQGEPNDGGGNEDCVLYAGHAWFGNRWNDDKCDKPTYFLCQASPVTSDSGSD
ncbi:PREDICTED: CD209 antigen-like [Branchiostoma belcheri]|uniref:CD209 antigen-like n=1 Tax=Branchiostoma belcheri TaxID=7741 RepID=A0A6P5AF35_BRABE|nr:PREDICTED: CD209 antigen-like [Branchiostoma belcheri]